MLMYIALAVAWNVIGGFAGYPSFATAAFFGLGAYVAGVLQLRYGVPMVAAWVAGGVASALFAALLGLAILHLRGHYFAIGSLVVAEVLRETINASTDFTGGGMGLNLPVLKMDVDTQAQLFYAAMLVVAVLALIAAALVDRGRLGFGLRCIQQNEDAAIILGVNTRGYKTAAFALSALFPGLAGAIYASWVNYIDPIDAFDILLTIKPIIMALIGGAGTVFGPAFGAVVFLLLEELVWRNLLEFHAGMLGILVVLLILFLPDGLLDPRIGAWRRALLGRIGLGGAR
jgi:branched-chain amino acid transport system permease protein